MRHNLLLTLVLIFISSYYPALAESIQGKIISVSDGDTVTLLTKEKIQVKIRLTEIDAPEKNQPYGQNSKNALSDLVFDKKVHVLSDGKDRYGRALGRMYLNQQDVNLYMVQNGYAWAYTKYLTDPAIKKAETIAREKKLGLWRLQADQTVPPWEWRKMRR